MPKPKHRSGVLAEVRNPLIFFALALLVIEGIFGIVVATSRMTSDQQFYSLLVMAGLFVLVVIIVAVITIRWPGNLYEAVEEQARRQEEVQARVRQVLEVMNDPVFARAIARAVAAETTKDREVEQSQQPGMDPQSGE